MNAAETEYEHDVIFLLKLLHRYQSKRENESCFFYQTNSCFNVSNAVKLLPGFHFPVS